jgi:hypothetical protein
LCTDRLSTLWRIAITTPPCHTHFIWWTLLCTLSSHFSAGNHRIRRGPTRCGTLAGGATSGDKLALDASTGRIYAPPQHCVVYRCPVPIWTSTGLAFALLFYALIKWFQFMRRKNEQIPLPRRESESIKN